MQIGFVQYIFYQYSFIWIQLTFYFLNYLNFYNSMEHFRLHFFTKAFIYNNIKKVIQYFWIDISKLPWNLIFSSSVPPRSRMCAPNGFPRWATTVRRRPSFWSAPSWTCATTRTPLRSWGRRSSPRSLFRRVWPWWRRSVPSSTWVGSDLTSNQ